MIYLICKVIEGEVIGLDFILEDIYIMCFNEIEEEFDVCIEEYVDIDDYEDGLINVIEEERNEENF